MNAIYLKLINQLEGLKMYEPEEEEYEEVSRLKKELSAQIYAMEHPVLEPMSEAELINFERMVEEEQNEREFFYDEPSWCQF